MRAQGGYPNTVEDLNNGKAGDSDMDSFRNSERFTVWGCILSLFIWMINVSFSLVG
jgi:hypothetical protein